MRGKLTPDRRLKDYYHSNWLSGGRLEVPRTPAQGVVLHAKLLRLKREAAARRVR